MSDIRLVQTDGTEAFSIDFLQTPIGQLDETQALVTAVIIAICSDRRALDADILPNPSDDDRRGWWGDTDAASIWGGWPIGSRLWLLEREKITDSNASQGSTIARVQMYIYECLQQFIANKIVSRVQVDVTRSDIQTIQAIVTLYRGPKAAIQLQFQSLWDEIGT